MSAPSPMVSAIVTTLRRPDIVLTAVDSVLKQTFPNFELIVVIDGPDAPTRERLKDVTDPRAWVLQLPENVGISEARNRGVEASRGQWVAFLDDDDEWLPEKLDIQLKSITAAGDEFNFSVSRFEERTSYGVRVRPKHFPGEQQDWGEAFYCEKVLLLPSTFLVKRSAMLAHPFPKHMRRHEDVDWLLRGRRSGALRTHWITDSLTVYHCESIKPRLSTTAEWKVQYQWCLDNAGLLTRKALPFYIGMLCIPWAQRSPKPVISCLFLLKEAFKRGEISFAAFKYLALVTLTTLTWRNSMRHRGPFMMRRGS